MLLPITDIWPRRGTIVQQEPQGRILHREKERAEMKSTAVLSLAALAALTVSGCAGVAPSSLRPVTEARTIELPQDVRWKYDSGWGFGHWEYLLMAGSYKAAHEDAGGIYYLGPKPSCLFQTVIADAQPPSGSSLECAIFVPHKATEQPLVFTINNGFYPQTEFNADKTPVTHRVGGGQQGANTGDVAGTAAAIAATTAPNAGPVASGLGAGIGAGIVAAMAEAERGRLIEFNTQPPSGWLQKAVTAR
ncbi:MAG TPA: hypothetical protein VFY73_25705 [Ideonella sp.]|uniref:hypothetical protein n=1 Tax=Ideonella sp. TaxID=1929293 RepID=UPI002E33F0ED|nr:hypothetical protein [Ideonella sp.]HEX5687427.1 hypothetical protein [Ideonella sp.]